MEAAHFRAYARQIERILKAGGLTPAHHAILNAWYRNLTGIGGDEEPRIPPGVMIFGLPDEARLALALLIAGDLIDLEPEEEAGGEAFHDFALVERHAQATNGVPKPAPASLSPDILTPLELAKAQLRQVAAKLPGAVLQRNLEVALESDDIGFVENEIVDISFRATQHRPS